MKINSISVVPQDVGCNARCKYCIAHLTKNVREGLKSPGINLPKLEKCFKYAKENGATTGIITSCGETLLGSWTNIENILWLCSKYFGQIDLHTNGIEILNPPDFGRDFSQMLAPYLTNVTITVPHFSLKKNVEHGLAAVANDYENLFEKLNDLGLTIRLSCVICKENILKDQSEDHFNFIEYINHFRALGVSQIVFRELWIPDILTTQLEEKHPIFEWSKKNRVYQTEIDSYLRLIASEYSCKKLNWWGNEQPYDYKGVAISSSTCTQNVTTEVVKSVVYRPDNYLYPDWDTKCRIM